MKEQLALQNILISKFEEARIRNPQLSRRAFSKRLGLSAGAASEFFNGQRKFSLKIAERIADKLALDPQERAELFGLFPKRVRRRSALQLATEQLNHSQSKAKGTADTAPLNYLQLSADHFRVIGDWHHFAILSLMRTLDFKSDAEWIAGRLGLSLTVVNSALDRLKRLGLIKVNNTGQFTRTKTRYRTSDDVANLSVQRAHSQYLENAKVALNSLGVELRDFTSLMLSMDITQLPRAKELVRKFQDDLSQELETKPGQEVFQLCIQLFPLTKIKGEKK